MGAEVESVPSGVLLGDRGDLTQRLRTWNPAVQALWNQLLG